MLLRKLGDSNPRYGNPYVSLANWWFQPLTQTSFQSLRMKLDALESRIFPLSFLKCGAKVQQKVKSEK